MTTPTLYPAGFSGTSNDYLRCKGDTGGGVTLVQTSVSVPASTSANTIIGLHPFRKGARLGYGSVLAVTDLDTGTNVTLNVGYVYDDNATYTNDDDAFVSGSTKPQTGGLIAMTETAGVSFVAEADGWFVAKNTAATTTTGTITANLNIAYDG